MSKYTMSFDSQLTEGYVLTAGIPTLTSSPAPLAVYANREGNTELLAIHDDGELYHVAREPLSESGWNFYGAGAGLDGIAAVGYQAAWALGSDSRFWKLAGNRWTQVPATLPGNAATLDLSAGSDGTIWALDANNQLYYYAPDGTWQPASGAPTLLVAPKGSSANAWAIDDTNTPVSSAGGAWSPAALPDGTLATAIAVGPDGTAWVTGYAMDSGATILYRRQNDSWQVMPGPDTGGIAQFCATGADELWALVCTGGAAGCNGSPWIEQFTNGQWQRPAGAPAPGISASSLSAIAAGADGAVFCCDTDGIVWRSRAGEWERCITPTGILGPAAGGKVTEVVAAEAANGTWYALFVQDGFVNLLRFSGRVWQSVMKVAAATNVGITHDQHSKQPIGFGITPSGNMLVVSIVAASGDEVVTFDEHATGNGQSLDGVTVNLAVIDDNLWITTAVIDGYLMQSWGVKGSPFSAHGITGFAPVSDADNPDKIRHFKQVVRLPWVHAVSDDPYAVAVDHAGNIFMAYHLGWDPSEGYSLGTYVQLSGTGVASFGAATQVSAVIDNDRMIRIYATDANGLLWVLRQSGTGDQYNPYTWTNWHPLGNDCRYLANGPGRRVTTELYWVGGDTTIARLVQSPTTKAWSAHQVKRPAGVKEENDYVSQYMTEITIVENGGLAAANLDVTVTAGEEATIRCGTKSYDIAPGQPITLTTDFMGKLRISSNAIGLHTPALTFQAPDLDAPAPIYPPQAVHDYLAGATTLPGKQPMTRDGGALVSAASQSGSSFGTPVTMSPGLDGPTASTVASTSLDVFAMKPSLAGPRGAVSLAIAGARAGASGSASAGGDSFWQELAGYAEDLNHAITNGIVKVEGVSRDLEKKVVSLTLALEGVGKQVIDFVIHTVHDAIDALHNVFRWIVDKLDKLIDWLKGLFDWHDIRNTQQVIQHFIESGFKAVDYLLKDQAQVRAKGFFQGLMGQIDQDFGTAGQLLSGKTFDNLVGSARTARAAAAPRRALRKVSPDDFPANGAQQNWLQQVIQWNLSGGDTGLDKAVLPMLADDWQKLKDSIDVAAVNGELQNAFNTMQTLLTDALTNPQGFKEKGVSDFLAALQAIADVAIVLAEQVVAGLLEVVTLLIENIDTLLNTPLDIPLVSSLYEEFSRFTGDDEELTVMNLATLGLAFQYTLLYKTLNGASNPPFTDDQVAAILKEPFLPPSAVLSATLPAPFAGDDRQEWAERFAAWSGVVALSDALTDYLAVLLVNTDGKDPIGVAKEAPMLAGIFSAVSLLSAQAMAFHLLENNWSWDWSDMSREERWTKGSWIAGWAPPLVDVIWVAVPMLTTIARAEQVGQIVLTIAGLVNVGVGITAGVMAEDTNAQIDNCGIAILSNAASSLTPLLMAEVLDATEGGSGSFKGWSDAFTDILAGVAVAVPTAETVGA